MDELDEFLDLAAGRLAEWEFSTFLVGSRVDPQSAAREEALWTEPGAAHAEAIKSELNREIGKRLADRMGKEPDFGHPDVVAIIETAFGTVEAQWNPPFVRARYGKLVRGIPQTRWPCKRCRGKGCGHWGGEGEM